MPGIAVCELRGDGFFVPGRSAECAFHAYRHVPAEVLEQGAILEQA